MDYKEFCEKVNFIVSEPCFDDLVKPDLESMTGDMDGRIGSFLKNNGFQRIYNYEIKRILCLYERIDKLKAIIKVKDKTISNQEEYIKLANENMELSKKIMERQNETLKSLASFLSMCVNNSDDKNDQSDEQSDNCS